MLSTRPLCREAVSSNLFDFIAFFISHFPPWSPYRSVRISLSLSLSLHVSSESPQNSKHTVTATCIHRYSATLFPVEEHCQSLTSTWNITFHILPNIYSQVTFKKGISLSQPCVRSGIIMDKCTRCESRYRYEIVALRDSRPLAFHNFSKNCEAHQDAARRLRLISTTTIYNVGGTWD